LQDEKSRGMPIGRYAEKVSEQLGESIFFVEKSNIALRVDQLIDLGRFYSIKTAIGSKILKEMGLGHDKFNSSVFHELSEGILWTDLILDTHRRLSLYPSAANQQDFDFVQLITDTLEVGAVESMVNEARRDGGLIIIFKSIVIKRPHQSDGIPDDDDFEVSSFILGLEEPILFGEIEALVPTSHESYARIIELMKN
jgi:hypothetical protein